MAACREAGEVFITHEARTGLVGIHQVLPYGCAVTFVRPQPPYYAVIITSSLTGEDAEGYARMSERMAELGEAQPGYLGRESMTDADGNDLTVIYYEDAQSVSRWKEVPAHLVAQRLGRERWYSRYQIEVSRVERHYRFERPPVD